MDLIDRQAAIDALMVRDKELRNINWYDKPYAEGECRGIDEALAIVSNLPSAQPHHNPDEWCTDCAEYDSEKHCCPRFNRVIRQTLSEQTEWNSHTVACLLAELFGDACACNHNGIDEWLPEKCEVIDACPNPVGVSCWEQFLKHRAERRAE